MRSQEGGEQAWPRATGEGRRRCLGKRVVEGGGREEKGQTSESTLFSFFNCVVLNYIWFTLITQSFAGNTIGNSMMLQYDHM